MPPTYNSLIYERLFTNCELWKLSHKQLPSETDRVIPDEDSWYRISDDTDLKRDIRWYWYETWYQVTLIWNVISMWYRLSEPVIHTEPEWGVNTNVKTKQAGNSYGGFDTLLISTVESVIHTEPKEVYLKDSDTKSMIPTYRRGQL